MEEQASVLLIKRAETLSQHRGEWAFPGGSIEAQDQTLLDTALRETQEEIGIRPNDIDVWGPLDAVFTGTGYLVWPFGGYVDPDIALAPDSAEVADVVRLPLDVIVDSDSKRTITRLDSATGREFGAYSYEGKIIWGATARMLSQVADTLAPAGDQAASGVVVAGSEETSGGNGD